MAPSSSAGLPVSFFASGSGFGHCLGSGFTCGGILAMDLHISEEGPAASPTRALGDLEGCDLAKEAYTGLASRYGLLTSHGRSLANSSFRMEKSEGGALGGLQPTEVCHERGGQLSLPQRGVLCGGQSGFALLEGLWKCWCFTSTRSVGGSFLSGRQ